MGLQNNYNVQGDIFVQGQSGLIKIQNNFKYSHNKCLY